MGSIDALSVRLGLLRPTPASFPVTFPSEPADSSANRAPEGRLVVVLMALGAIAAIGLVAATTPITGRGDFGQWLMTSRYYLGQEVPDYRVVTALPPLVPVLLAGAQSVFTDPIVALQVVNFVVLFGLGFSFFVLGAVFLRQAIGGLACVAAALLITDRYLELLSFGGLLQAAALTFLNLAIAAFVHASDGRRGAWLWAIGSLSLALAALSHVGTATTGVPIALAIGAVILAGRRRLGLRRLALLASPLVLALGGVGVYWWVSLLPASGEYVSNPASLAYRGPSGLFRALFAYWPTLVVVVLGSITIILGWIRERLQPAPARWRFLLVWAGLAWATLALAVVGGASTDYARFATVLLAPLVVAVGEPLTWLARWFERYLRSLVPTADSPLPAIVAAAALILPTGPFAMMRYQTLMDFYPPRDPAALSAVVRYVDAALQGSAYGTVLTEVREGKWLEGVTGRTALFSQPVRYAFRRIEWQRSIDADAILRSTGALTNEYFFAKFSDSAQSEGGRVPRGLVIGANHGGEYVDLLETAPFATSLIGAKSGTVIAEWTALGSGQSATAEQASISTAWLASGSASAPYTETVTLPAGGSTLSITHDAPGHRIRTELRPVAGVEITTVRFIGSQARVCFTQVADREPCLQIWTAPADAAFSVTATGLSVESPGSSLRLSITDLTAGNPSTGLAALEPRTLLDTYRIGAALLQATDSSFDARRRRLEELGFRLAQTMGPYVVFLRTPTERAD